MTPTTLAAAILRDVKRYDPDPKDCRDIVATPDGGWLNLDEVLAALTAAMDPALSERAGEVLEGVTPGDWQCFVGNANGRGLVRIEADGKHIASMVRGAESEANGLFIAEAKALITALLTQNAALRAEVRKIAMDAVSAGCQAQEAWEAQKAAEAERDALRAERDELAAAIDSIETSHGLTSNGNLWRFWSKKAREYIDSCDRDRKAAEAQIAALTARVEGLTGALKRIGTLAPIEKPPEPYDENGWQVADTSDRHASMVAAKDMWEVADFARAALSATTEDGATIRNFQTVPVVEECLPTADDWECPIGAIGCHRNCGSYGCGN